MRSLGAQRRKIVVIFEDFWLPYSRAQPLGPTKKPSPPQQYSPSGSFDEDGDDGNDNNDDDDQSPRKKRKPAAKKSGKKDKKAADVNDQEEYESPSDNDDGGDTSGDDQPVKTTQKGMKKGGTSIKHKRGAEGEGESGDSDCDQPTPGASGRKKAGGPRRRSGRGRGGNRASANQGVVKARQESGGGVRARHFLILSFFSMQFALCLMAPFLFPPHKGARVIHTSLVAAYR